MSQKGSTVTEILILALLKAHPQHGYEIRKHTALILRQPKLNTNLLYPALHRLELSKAIEKKVLEQKGRPAKHVYSITPLGAERFAQLLRQFGEVDAEDEDEFLVRVAFFQFLDESSPDTNARLTKGGTSECPDALEDASRRLSRQVCFAMD